METLLKIVQTVNSYLSDYILIVMLVAAGLFFSIKTRFVQVRYFGAAMRKAFGEVKLFGKKHDSGMSSFQALTTAIAAQVVRATSSAHPARSSSAAPARYSGCG